MRRTVKREEEEGEEGEVKQVNEIIALFCLWIANIFFGLLILRSTILYGNAHF